MRGRNAASAFTALAQQLPVPSSAGPAPPARTMLRRWRRSRSRKYVAETRSNGCCNPPSKSISSPASSAITRPRSAIVGNTGLSQQPRSASNSCCSSRAQPPARGDTASSSSACSLRLRLRKLRRAFLPWAAPLRWLRRLFGCDGVGFPNSSVSLHLVQFAAVWPSSSRHFCSPGTTRIRRRG